jgi:hypothetical protein
MAFKSTVHKGPLKSVLSVLKLKAPFTYQNLQITDVLLDADSKNLFFVTGANALTVTISEATAFALDKGIADAATIVEVYVSAFSAAKAETLSVAESAALESELNKSETTSLTDSPVFNAGKSLTDTPIITESLVSAFAKALADTSSISEASALASGKNIGNPDTSSTVTYTVTVASGVNSYGGGHHKYYFNGGVSPEIDLELGVTYRFDQSDSSNSGHPLRFSTTANGTHGGGTAYTTNVTVSGTPGQAGAYVEIDFDTFANSLHYYCAVHSGMGNKIITRPAQIVTMLESFARTATFERVFTDATSLDDTASASDDLATESGINKNNIVSVDESLIFGTILPLADTTSIAESLAKTVSFQRTFSDTPTIGEAFAYALALGTIANNVSVSESINVQLILGANSVFNASPLNTYTINS